MDTDGGMFVLIEFVWEEKKCSNQNLLLFLL